MYLSHPRDLISSMSSGCSRNTALLPHPDHLAQLLSPKSDWHTPNRQSTKVPAACSSPVSDQAYTRLSDSSSISTSYAHNRMERTTLCLDYNKTGGIPRAVSSSHTHSVSRLFRSQHFRKVWEELDAGNPNVRPQHPYTELIKLCILKRPEGKLTLNQLYRDLEDKFPFFDASANGKGWKNTLRHNLSTQPYFIKLDREHGQSGKGHYWAYCPDLEKPTSLAQSSVVQLSALWPPTVSTASVPAENSARKHCSANEFPLNPSRSCSLGADLKVSTSFEGYNLGQNLDEIPRIYCNCLNANPQDEMLQDSPVLVHIRRRLSSPVRRDPYSLVHQHKRDPPISRMRSATVSTISPLLSLESSTSCFSREGDRRRSYSIWPHTSTSFSPTVSSSDVVIEEKQLSRNHFPTLPHLPDIHHLQSHRKSLGDWYLSNPISTRRKSLMDSSIGVRSRASPYSFSLS